MRSLALMDYASHLPSWETAVSPSPFIFIMSSKVIGRLDAADEVFVARRSGPVGPE